MFPTSSQRVVLSHIQCAAEFVCSRGGSSAQSDGTCQLSKNEAKRRLSMPNNQAIHLEPLLVRANEAARLLGIGRTKFYEMNCTGQLGPVPVCLGGNCKRWRINELRQWVCEGCKPRDEWTKSKERDR